MTAVHRDRSVTAATKKLHLRQSAVTLQIRSLQTLAGQITHYPQSVNINRSVITACWRRQARP
ncbi:MULTISPECIES: helix-turn-helix domain-containing protein [unclassified Tardiphaga]|uniref:helix-turn-helix domain-containing protein n=1 Tax=unclassified Tardiphaga TaxID=2631404 RepID=UPI000E71002B